MRLESALYSSRSGIDAHGMAIGVVGDNIANSNTTGFKASRAEFQDLVADGYDGHDSWGGPDIGNGTAIAAVRPIHIGGNLDQTGRELDTAIDGNGFFLVGDAESPLLTRDGSFTLDAEGFLTTNTGQRVLGFGVGGEQLTQLNMRTVTGIAGQATTAATLAGNLPSNAPITTPPANPATFDLLAQSASYQTTFDVYDSLGASHPVTLSFFRTAANSWTVQAHANGGDLQGGTAGVPTQLGANLNLTFNANGTIDPANVAAAILPIAPTFANGSAPAAITVGIGNFVQFASPGSTTAITVDGKGAGRVVSYEIEKDGTIQAVLSNGSRASLGTLALGDVTNVDGLDRVGDNDFGQTAQSGTATFLRPGSERAGVLVSRTLEQSTTDIGKEFTTLVLMQRGYEANSKVLNSTSDLLRQTIQLLG